MAKASLLQQLAAFLRRNCRLKIRMKRQTTMEFLFPVLMVAVLAVIRNLMKPVAPHDVEAFPSYPLDAFPVQPNSLFYISPNSQKLVSLLNPVLCKTIATCRYFSTSNEAETDYLEQKPEKISRIIGINFSNLSAYSIRMPYSTSASVTFNFSTTDCSLRPGGSTADGLAGCDANKYVFSGFAWLQNTINSAIIKDHSNWTTPNMFFQLFPTFAQNSNLMTLQILNSIYFVFAYSIFVSTLTVILVTEKENKIKESMRMAGMRDSAYWLGWLLVYAVVIAIVTGVVTFISWATSVFTHSDFFLLFLLLFLYGLSTVCLAFAVTPFFRKAELAGFIVSFTTIIFSLIYLAISQTRKSSNSDGPVSSIPASGQWLLSLLSPVALALGIDQGIYLDVNHGGMHFYNANVGQFPVYGSLVMLTVDFVLYGVIAVYFDNVLQGDYGQRRPLWFFLMPSFWCPDDKRIHVVTDELINDVDIENGSHLQLPPAIHADYEPVAIELLQRNVIRLSNVKKVYNAGKKDELLAVDGISLDIYEGQITALLGHNGAGKTTLMNILTGMTKCSEGFATIYNLDVTNTNDMNEIRSLTGVCPQHNILTDELSCREHLELFARIKGVASHSINTEIAKILHDVGLLEQENVFVKLLSGGQKRKLSLAIALIGNPKVLFLDEPTAGMDPVARREVWELLKKMKHERVILLTTHFMDEADILTDRKAIISKGKLKSIGSSLFLKTRFGVGYHLSLDVGNSPSTDLLTDFIQRHIPSAHLQRSHGQEVTYTLPLSSVDKFPELFVDIEEHINSSVNSTDTRSTEIDFELPQASEPLARDFIITSYGVSMTTLEEVFLKLGETEEIKDTADEQGENANNSDITMADLQGMMENKDGPFRRKCRQVRALIRIRFQEELRMKVVWFTRLILPVIFMVIGAVFQLVIPVASSDAGSNSTNPLWFHTSMYASVAGESDNMPNVTYCQSTQGFFERTFRDTLEQQEVGLSDVDYHESLLKSAPHNMGINLTRYYNNSYVAIQYNGSAAHSLPTVLQLVGNTFNRMAQNGAHIDDIMTASWPWPELQETNLLQYLGQSLPMTIMVGISVVMVAPTFVVSIVKERQQKCRTQLRISGITANIYWLSRFLVDAIQFCIPLALTVVILLAFQVRFMLYGGAVVSLVLIYIMYIPTLLLLTYVISFAFDKYTSAQSIVPTIYIMAGYIPYLPVAILYYSGKTDVSNLLNYIFVCLDPPYEIFSGLLQISLVYQNKAIAALDMSVDIDVGEYFYWDANIVILLIVPFIQSILLYCLLRVLEVKKNGGNVADILGCRNGIGQMSPTSTCSSRQVLIDEDCDVAAEKQMVEELSKSSDRQDAPVLLVQNLRIEFPKNEAGCRRDIFNRSSRVVPKVKLAVASTSFAVRNGEVFGLLGPNGAGKTTTLNMITAEIGATEGKVQIAGFDVRTDVVNAFLRLGFCPQDDPHWEMNTLQEHLECYAAIRGIPQQNISRVIDYLVQGLQLVEHRSKLTKELSGGTKRKLTYAMSLLGDLKVVLMDEPSTGLDPVSKRFLWDMILESFIRRPRGAVLTTHYMEEADALCTRVAIMVNGRLQCLGSTQHLKNKYGTGYVLELKLSASRSHDYETVVEQVNSFVQNLFPTSKLTENFGGRLTYRITQEGICPLSRIFESLERGKKTFALEEYSFSQSTLEQVFLELAKHQRDENEEDFDGIGEIPQQ